VVGAALNRREAIGLSVTIVGLVVVLVGAFLAYKAYVDYRPLHPSSPSLSEAITGATFDLVNVAAKIGFIALIIWAGGLIMARGIEVLRQEA
jgi:hypothetical protein